MKRFHVHLSTRGPAPGLDHLGLQVEDEDELKSMRTRLQAADSSLIEETAQACCYATSDKYWITDPQGIAWESFRTLEPESTSAACCVPPVASGDACCAT